MHCQIVVNGITMKSARNFLRFAQIDEVETFVRLDFNDQAKWLLTRDEDNTGMLYSNQFRARQALHLVDLEPYEINELNNSLPVTLYKRPKEVAVAMIGSEEVLVEYEINLDQQAIATMVKLAMRGLQNKSHKKLVIKVQHTDAGVFLTAGNRRLIYRTMDRSWWRGDRTNSHIASIFQIYF